MLHISEGVKSPILVTILSGRTFGKFCNINFTPIPGIQHLYFNQFTVNNKSKHKNDPKNDTKTYSSFGIIG